MKLLMLLIVSASPQGNRELLIPSSPYLAVYGDALVASQRDHAYLANPSLAAKIAYPSIHLAHTEWFVGTRKDRVDLLLPNNWGTLGVGAGGFHVWNLEHRDEPDDQPETFYAYTTDLLIRYARMIGNFAVGAEARMVAKRIYTYSGLGFNASIGASYFTKTFTFGLAMRNLGTPITLLAEPTPQPTRVLLGGSWNPEIPVQVQAGAGVGFDGSLNASIGAGGTIFDILHLYAGGGYGSAPRAGSGISLQLDYLELSYAALLTPGIGLTHHIGVLAWLPPSQKEDPILRKMRETAQTFVESGKRDLLNRDYRHAVQQFDLALVWNPENPEAQEGYQEALAKERQRQASIHLEKAIEFRNQGNYLDALRVYEFVLSLDPDNQAAKSGRADMKLKVEQMPMLAQGQLSAEAVRLFEAGVQAFRDFQYKEALAYWEELAERFPYIEEIDPFVSLASERLAEKLDSLLLDAYAARERDALNQAMDLVRRVLKLDPTDSRATALREELTALIHRRSSQLLVEAIEYFDARRYQLAAETFNKVLAIDPTNPTAQRYLNRIQREEKLTRQDLDQLNLSAVRAYALGDYETAIRIWEQIIAVDSTLANVQRNLERARRKKALLDTSLDAGNK